MKRKRLEITAVKSLRADQENTEKSSGGIAYPTDFRNVEFALPFWRVDLLGQ